MQQIPVSPAMLSLIARARSGEAVEDEAEIEVAQPVQPRYRYIAGRYFRNIEWTTLAHISNGSPRALCGKYINYTDTENDGGYRVCKTCRRIAKQRGVDVSE